MEAIMNGLTLVTLGAALALPQQPAADISKWKMEWPAKHVLAAQPAPADVRKMAIESPAKAVIAKSTSPEFLNPKVEPGKVHWHGDLVTACEAAKKSGKPVLLFHLMG
jgi:hypothetical protein